MHGLPIIGTLFLFQLFCNICLVRAVFGFTSRCQKMECTLARLDKICCEHLGQSSAYTLSVRQRFSPEQLRQKDLSDGVFPRCLVRTMQASTK